MVHREEGKNEEVLVVAGRVVAAERAEERWPGVEQPPVTSLWAGTCHSGMRTFPAVPGCAPVLLSSFAFKMLQAGATPTLYHFSALAKGDSQSSDLSCFSSPFFSVRHGSEPHRYQTRVPLASLPWTPYWSPLLVVLGCPREHPGYSNHRSCTTLIN